MKLPSGNGLRQAQPALPALISVSLIRNGVIHRFELPLSSERFTRKAWPMHPRKRIPAELLMLADQQAHYHLVRGRVTLRYGWMDCTERSCEAAHQVALVLRRCGWDEPYRGCPDCALAISVEDCGA
ncbi:hypothetical protein GCM10009785_24580 [Brooklawnia cerclae]